MGVIFSNDLKFDKHINQIINKANQVTGIIKRSFSYIDKDMFLKLYKTIIRPQIEYANVIWHPQYKRQSILLEKVQKRATKMVKDIQHLTYTDRLIALDLPTVKYRQTRGDLIQTYKIIHNIDNIDSQNFFTMTNDNTRRNGELKLYKEFAKTNPRCNFLSYIIIISNICCCYTYGLTGQNNIMFEG